MALRARLNPPREPQADWPWHDVNFSSVRASLLSNGARRMEAEHYLTAGFKIRQAIEASPTGCIRLENVARISQPSRLKGIYVNKEFGTPFLAAGQAFDIRPVPRKWLSLNRTNDYRDRFVAEGTILLTRSGSVGRATLAHPALNSALISDDLIRIHAKKRDWWGWIYAYLRAPSVREMMKTAQYGHIIKHLETHHLDPLPIFDLPKEFRTKFDEYARRILDLRNKAHILANTAEEEYSNVVGDERYMNVGKPGFTTQATEMFRAGRRLEANYHNPVARAAERAIQSNAQRLHRLENLVERVHVPGRFKHVYGDEGVPYLDSAQILEVAPDIKKRVLSMEGKKQDDYLVNAGTLLMPCSGQLHGIIGSVVLATSWHENKILTNHILRIIPKSNSEIRVGYLQVVLGHPHLGRPRVLRGAFGSSVPELSPKDIKALSVPRFPTAIEDRIADLMEEASRLRTQADEVEELVAAEAEEQVNRFLSGD